MKIKEAILVADGKISINPDYCWIDSWAFERMLGKADKLWEENPQDNGTAATFAVKALNLYKSRFLDEETQKYWLIHYRERLRSKFLRGTIKLGKYLEKNGKLEDAVEHYQRGLDIDPHIEEFYQRLMICFLALNRKAEATATYKNCARILRTSLDISPSKETERLYQKIKNS